MSSTLNILRIDASARIERSHTRSLADRFAREWSARRPDDPILHRDVGVLPPPAITEDWIAAAFTPRDDRTQKQRQVLELSDTMIEELRRADLLLIATPLYNYGMPASLKAWVDQVIRVNETFSFDLSRGDWPIEPVFHERMLVLLTSSGEFGFAPGGPRAHLDHLTPHLQTCAETLGVSESYHVRVEYQEFGDERHRRSLAEGHEEVSRLATILATRSNDE